MLVLPPTGPGLRRYGRHFSHEPLRAFDTVTPLKPTDGFTFDS